MCSKVMAYSAENIPYFWKQTFLACISALPPLPLSALTLSGPAVRKRTERQFKLQRKSRDL